MRALKFVSLTLVICTLFLKFIAKALQDHLVNNNLLLLNQFSFCSGHSYSTQLLVTMNEWFWIWMRVSIHVDAAYLDFKKAFDNLPHIRLVTKLKGYGLQDQVLKSRSRLPSITVHCLLL